MTIDNVGFAVASPGAQVAKWHYEIRDLLEDDVLVDVHYCGICSTDLHMAKHPIFGQAFPLVPGHEMSGLVAKVGSKVSKFSVGDRVAIGCWVGSCRKCTYCQDNTEMYCPEGKQTYGSIGVDGRPTYGGYGKHIIVNEHFVLRVPAGLPLEYAAPLMCAGVTTWTPALKYGWIEGGKHVGVLGLGGLGHMAVLWAKKMGNKVTVISRSMNKYDDAIKLGVDHYLVNTDKEKFAAAKNSMDCIVDTIPRNAELNDYLNLLAPNGTYIIVSPAMEPHQVSPMSLLRGNCAIRGSMSAGIKSSQEMLDYAAKHQVFPWIEVVSGNKINEAWERVEKGQVIFRAVIDVKSAHGSN
eukprot:Gregarina_sp_Pseudo_9__2348@NODE_265_length_3358_cov_208_164206_g248_i0_p2_GENE_NODE_265_length_3358_cov_208_164206_g248_i0NODE_265_length_3358_cov_208_164206_g248_i0_p2_ORF_typecomplete_len352_score59_88ADH_N/PF08240_12/3_1e30ADH_zinc_N/PF00107_26/1_9e16Glu_dehyd_C/PF16912_5/3_1e13ADH_zinc_N_2/PF13602_6/1_1e07AlaDh_PNT_C/PF01262_21/3_7e062Hacid_dh_C/PF02826_19/3_3e05NAD_binding_2/PF03446_15/0_001IlvN/PF07991_12/0_049IlvN/PF07991_12/8e03Shikimate_DH/PF01488_20/0_055AdoHcyase_NAD/PF00670_21/0_081